MKDIIKDKVVEKAVKQAVDTGSKVAKQSVEDWMDYIQEHPVQSLVFGSVVYLALKGLVTSILK